MKVFCVILVLLNLYQIITATDLTLTQVECDSTENEAVVNEILFAKNLLNNEELTKTYLLCYESDGIDLKKSQVNVAFTLGQNTSGECLVKINSCLSGLEEQCEKHYSILKNQYQNIHYSFTIEQQQNGKLKIQYIVFTKGCSVDIENISVVEKSVSSLSAADTTTADTTTADTTTADTTTADTTTADTTTADTTTADTTTADTTTADTTTADITTADTTTADTTTADTTTADITTADTTTADTTTADTTANSTTTASSCINQISFGLVLLGILSLYYII